MTDIFIKTYPGDFIWLEYCIKSIEKFVTGFRKIVIVTDSGTELKIDSKLPIDIIYENLPNETHPCTIGIGYVWMQCVKLNWYKYTDANYVLQIDSDMMFTDKIDISYYRDDNKIKWFYRDWSEVGIGQGLGCGSVHRNPVNFFIKRESTRDHMPAPTWILSRKTTELFHKWVEKEWGSIWDYFNIHSRSLWINNSSGTSEYNMYGNFIEFFYNDEYKFVHVNEYKVPIRQSWSWGGLKEDEIEYRKKLLEL